MSRYLRAACRGPETIDTEPAVKTVRRAQNTKLYVAGVARAHHTTAETMWADEAARDAHAAWLTPDPASQSGHSVRVIGYSVSARTVLTVILLDADADPSERPDGGWWGANAWASNPTDRNLYGKEQSHEQD